MAGEAARKAAEMVAAEREAVAVVVAARAAEAQMVEVWKAAAERVAEDSAAGVLEALTAAGKVAPEVLPAEVAVGERLVWHPPCSSLDCNRRSRWSRVGCMQCS